LHGAAIYRREPVPQGVELAERFLDMAKSGEIVGGVYVASCADGSTEYNFGGYVGSFEMIGKLTYAAHDLMADRRQMDDE